MKLIFKITVHHGTDFNNVGSIIKNGFDINSISCATQDKEFAKGYGNTLLTFKYPFELRFSCKTIAEDLEYLHRFISDYFSKSLITGVAGFKPMIKNENRSDRKLFTKSQCNKMAINT